jgi:hypothetical protein
MKPGGVTVENSLGRGKEKDLLKLRNDRKKEQKTKTKQKNKGKKAFEISETPEKRETFLTAACARTVQ